jgi:hypothetical protein
MKGRTGLANRCRRCSRGLPATAAGRALPDRQGHRRGGRRRSERYGLDHRSDRWHLELRPRRPQLAHLDRVPAELRPHDRDRGRTGAGRALCLAQRGQGATLNGRPIAVSGAEDLKRACVELGWSTRIHFERYLAVLQRGLPGRRGRHSSRQRDGRLNQMISSLATAASAKETRPSAPLPRLPPSHAKSREFLKAAGSFNQHSTPPGSPKLSTQYGECHGRSDSQQSQTAGGAQNPNENSEQRMYIRLHDCKLYAGPENGKEFNDFNGAGGGGVGFVRLI